MTEEEMKKHHEQSADIGTVDQEAIYPEQAFSRSITNSLALGKEATWMYEMSESDSGDDARRLMELAQQLFGLKVNK